MPFKSRRWRKWNCKDEEAKWNHSARLINTKIENEDAHYKNEVDARDQEFPLLFNDQSECGYSGIFLLDIVNHSRYC